MVLHRTASFQLIRSLCGIAPFRGMIRAMHASRAWVDGCQSLGGCHSGEQHSLPSVVFKRAHACLGTQQSEPGTCGALAGHFRGLGVVPWSSEPMVHAAKHISPPSEAPQSTDGLGLLLSCYA